MKRLFVEDAKSLSCDQILKRIEAAGFNLVAGIGYDWTVHPDGRDCEFTQPPTRPTAGCPRCRHHMDNH